MNSSQERLLRLIGGEGDRGRVFAHLVGDLAAKDGGSPVLFQALVHRHDPLGRRGVAGRQGEPGQSCRGAWRRPPGKRPCL